MDSILTSIKKLLGITEDYTHFDTDLVIHINTVFSVLTQLGVGPSTGFFIKDKTAKWTDFIEDETRLEAVKSYMYLKVRLLFDPPLSSSVMDAINRSISELEFRLNVTAEQIIVEESDSSLEPKTFKGIVNCDVLNVREYPSSRADIVGIISVNTIVEISGEQNDYYSITAGEIAGYCMSKYITKIENNTVKG